MSARRQLRQLRAKAWANGVLDRVRNGDKTPSQAEILRALVITGDLRR
jgi:hypothetical protein